MRCHWMLAGAQLPMMIQQAELLVRIARPEDANAIRDLQILSLQVLATKDYSPPQMRALLNSKLEVRGWDELHFVAETGGMIVGFGALARDRPWVNALFVHPEFTRQGIATQLMAAMEEEALRRGDRTLEVVASLTGEKFYLKVGFELLGRISVAVEASPRTAIPCLRMQKRLLADWEPAWLTSRGYLGSENGAHEDGGYEDNTFSAIVTQVGWMVLGAGAIIIVAHVLSLLTGT